MSAKFFDPEAPKPEGLGVRVSALAYRVFLRWPCSSAHVVSGNQGRSLRHGASNPRSCQHNPKRRNHSSELLLGVGVSVFTNCVSTLGIQVNLPRRIQLKVRL